MNLWKPHIFQSLVMAIRLIIRNSILCYLILQHPTPTTPAVSSRIAAIAAPTTSSLVVNSLKSIFEKLILLLVALPVARIYWISNVYLCFLFSCIFFRFRNLIYHRLNLIILFCWLVIDTGGYWWTDPHFYKNKIKYKQENDAAARSNTYIHTYINYMMFIYLQFQIRNTPTYTTSRYVDVFSSRIYIYI